MNIRSWKAAGLLPIVLSLALAACNDLTDSSSSITGPSERSDVVIIKKSKRGFTIARETDPSVGEISSVIGHNGGELRIGKQVLIVPKGAVNRPTTFRMVKASGDLKVRLTATRVTENDIGKRGFRKPLTLRMSYEGVANLTGDLSGLRIVWVRSGGQEVELATEVDQANKLVEAKLRHFSDYALAWP